MVSFENFVKSMPPSLSELKVTPSFCFPFKIYDDPTASNMYVVLKIHNQTSLMESLANDEIFPRSQAIAGRFFAS